MAFGSFNPVGMSLSNQTGPLAAQRFRDPRFAYANALIQSGSDTSPVQSPWQGLARLGSGLAGGWLAHDAMKEWDTRESAYQKAVADALKLGSSTPAVTRTQDEDQSAYGGPAKGEQVTVTPAVAPNTQAMIAALSANKDAAPMAAQFQLSSIAAQQAAAQQLANAQAMIPIKVAEALAMITPKVAETRAMTPAKVEEANALITPKVEEQRQLNPILAQRAGSTEAAQIGARNAPVAATLPGVGPTTLPAASVVPATTAAVEQQAKMPQTVAAGEDKLRDDFNAQPAVKAYREVVPIWNSMVEAAGKNTRAADLNLVYGLAKIMDPTSVVREGEMVMVQNTSALPDWLIGQINRLNGGAGLQPETRNAVMSEAGSRAQQFENAYGSVVQQFGDIAARRPGTDKRNIIIETATRNPYEPNAGLSPEDKAALDWATANPNDPRAALIRQKLGR